MILTIRIPIGAGSLDESPSLLRLDISDIFNKR